jgi:hypothetical protein
MSEIPIELPYHPALKTPKLTRFDSMPPMNLRGMGYIRFPATSQKVK